MKQYKIGDKVKVNPVWKNLPYGMKGGDVYTISEIYPPDGWSGEELVLAEIPESIEGCNPCYFED